MTTIGYHASHEQFPPSALLRYVRAAEQAGFTAAMCSDHFAPWSEAQGQSGFAWSWLGAALATTSLPFGVVNAPGYRYHPAIVAQAAATLAEMFPGRFWVALGTGQALSEHITGEKWPPKAERNARLAECVEVIRALWAGETVSHDGRITVEEATLYTRPAEPPAIVGPALSPETAEFAGGWADALITINQPVERLRAIVDAFRRGGGDGKPIYLQIHLSYAEDEATARRYAHDQWRTTMLPAPAGEELRLPAQFEAVAQYVRPDEMDRSVHISADLARHLDWLRGYVELGISKLFLHNVGPNQEQFIEAFGARVLPALT
ncbi:MAG: TIGR03885 family FMN-dependent LLM class oxidoreductase [Thermomicrobiales bacterium]|nr:TIGR03885 family FMN-dependent LLM class oxidoreductase [Thermomicrobiales bacterium]